MALKAVSREAARHKKAASGDGDEHRRIWFERDALLALRHPLLPSLRSVLATDAVVGFAIDHDRCGGGDLNSLRRRQTEKMFSDSVIRWIQPRLLLQSPPHFSHKIWAHHCDILARGTVDVPQLRRRRSTHIHPGCGYTATTSSRQSLRCTPVPPILGSSYTWSLAAIAANIICFGASAW